MGDVRRSCLLVLCGLPASGKTSFTKQLNGYLGHSDLTDSYTASSCTITGDTSTQSTEPAPLKTTDDVPKARVGGGSAEASVVQSQWRLVVLEYDHLLPHDTEARILSQTDQETSAWKQYRGNIILCVEALLSHLTDTHQDRGRQTAGTNLNAQSPPTMEKPETVPQELWDSFVSMVTNSSAVWCGEANVCVIIDDNMYYRSMRFPYYQIARKYRTGFCQLYLDCDVTTALTRNAQRPVRVPDDVIVTMATRIQPPDPANNSWEKYSTDAADIVAVCRMIVLATGDPVTPAPVPDVEARSQARLVCSSNLTHRADQHLRRLVTTAMAAAKEKGLPKDELQCLSAHLQTQRKQILGDLKCGRLSVDADIDGDVSSHVLGIVEHLLMANDIT